MTGSVCRSPNPLTYFRRKIYAQRDFYTFQFNFEFCGDKGKARIDKKEKNVDKKQNEHISTKMINEIN